MSFTRMDRRFSNIVIGDKGYVSSNVEDALRERRMRLLTPRKVNSRRKKHSKADRDSLRRRHTVENLFSRLDKFKKIHCRHEKNLESYRGLTLFGMMLLVVEKNMQRISD